MERNRQTEAKILQRFRSAVPFLRQIPGSAYFNLDPYGFYLPEGEVAQVRKDLEKRLIIML